MRNSFAKATGMVMASVVFGSAAVMAAEGSTRVMAAGSLRLAVTEMRDVFHASGGPELELLFGPSGKLRQMIEAGEPVGVFLSASKKHSDALAAAGKLSGSDRFTRNVLCLMAAPGRAVSEPQAIDVMLDPAVRLGTSTPKADPSGDYTWEMFRKVEALRPGAFATLDAKALKLTGGAVDKKRKALPYPAVFEGNQADVFVSYCTNAVATAAQVPGLTWVKLPDEINVGAVYGMGVATRAGDAAKAFADFVRSEDGQAILAKYGFK